MNRKKLAVDFANSLNHLEIEKIILFGSVARGDDREDSDILQIFDLDGRQNLRF